MKVSADDVPGLGAKRERSVSFEPETAHNAPTDVQGERVGLVGVRNLLEEVREESFLLLLEAGADAVRSRTDNDLEVGVL